MTDDAELDTRIRAIQAEYAEEEAEEAELEARAITLSPARGEERLRNKL